MPFDDISFECSRCGDKMEPVWFMEDEYRHGVKTGRRRRAVSYFECVSCGNRACVDDSFDGPWIFRERLRS